MPSGHVYIAVSVDGCIARQDHTIDWLMKQQTEGEDHGGEAFFTGLDGIVMGANSFRTVLGFDVPWPYTVPLVVMSRTLTADDIPEPLRDKVRIAAGAPAAVMEGLGAEGWNRVWIDGGALVQSFLRAGLIEDMVLTTIPILIGDGIRLFGDLDADIDLTHVDTRSFPSGLVQTTWKLGAATS